jgi:hypothetical protein
MSSPTALPDPTDTSLLRYVGVGALTPIKNRGEDTRNVASSGLQSYCAYSESRLSHVLQLRGEKPVEIKRSLVLAEPPRRLRLIG